jgi:hypothetical protein
MRTWSESTALHLSDWEIGTFVFGSEGHSTVGNSLDMSWTMDRPSTWLGDLLVHRKNRPPVFSDETVLATGCSGVAYRIGMTP